jgi:FkbM family methyltransferase
MFFLKWLLLLAKPLVSRFPKIAAMYRGIRDQLEYMEEPQSTPWGFKLAGNSAMVNGTFEPIETKLVRRLLKDVDVLVNVGANVGYYCCHALSMGKSVIAFEPMPRNLHYLYKNMQANGWDSVEILPIALSNRVGILDIYGSDTGASLVKGWAGIPESHRTMVSCSTLDTALNTRLYGRKVLVLADIEGAEKLMLDGSNLALLNSPKPIWLVEIVTNENQPNDKCMNPNFVATFDIFFKNGYEAFNADEIEEPVTPADIDLISRGVIQPKSYNFLFREARER